MKNDIRQINAIAQEFGMTPIQRKEYGDYVEDCKRSGDRGTEPRGDFTYEELRDKARDFLGVDE